MRCALLVALAIVAVGCGDPVFQAGSREELKESLEEVRAALPEAQRKEFQKAYETVMMTKLLELGSADEAMRYLDGKSAAYVIAEARSIAAELARKQKEAEEQRKKEQVERLVKEIEETTAAIKSLRDAKEVKAANREALKKFEILSAGLKRIEEEFRSYNGILLEVRNGLSVAVSRAYFRGVYQTPGRSVPWLRDEFNYAIPGGLEPRESARWGLRPNMFSSWGKLEIRSDAVLSVEVVRVDGADGKELLNSDFNQQDQLDRLEARLKDLVAQRAKLIAAQK